VEDTFIPESAGNPGEVLSAEAIEEHGLVLEEADVPYYGDAEEDAAIMKEVNGDVEPVATTKAADADSSDALLQGVKDCLSILRNGIEPDLAKKSGSALKEPAGPAEPADNSAPAAGSHVLTGQESEDDSQVEDHFPSIDFGGDQSTVTKSVTHKINKDDSDDTEDEVVDHFPSVKL